MPEAADEESVVREVWRRWNAGEREFDDAVMHPEIEIHSHMVGHVFQGADGVSRWIEEIDQQFDTWNLTLDEIRPARDGGLLATGRIQGRGINSGIDLDEPAAWIVDFRDRRVSVLRNFIGREAADQAVALAS